MLHENASEVGLAFEPPTVRADVGAGARRDSSCSALRVGRRAGRARAAARRRPERPHLGHGRPGPGPAAGRDRPARPRPLRLAHRAATTGPQAMAADVAAVAIARSRPTRRRVVGMSLGGLTALALAGHAARARAERLVLVDVTPGVDQREGGRRSPPFVDGPPELRELRRRCSSARWRSTRPAPSRRCAAASCTTPYERDDGTLGLALRPARRPARRPSTRTSSTSGTPSRPWQAPITAGAGRPVAGRRRRRRRRAAPPPPRRRGRWSSTPPGHSIQGDQPVELARILDGIAWPIAQAGDPRGQTDRSVERGGRPRRDRRWSARAAARRSRRPRAGRSPRATLGDRVAGAQVGHHRGHLVAEDGQVAVGIGVQPLGGRRRRARTRSWSRGGAARRARPRSTPARCGRTCRGGPRRSGRGRSRRCPRPTPPSGRSPWARALPSRAADRRAAPAAGRPATGRANGGSPAHTCSIERDLIVEALVATVERRLEGPVVLVAPADPDAQGEAPARQHVDGGGLLGHLDGRVHGQHHDRRHEPHPLGEHGGGRQGHEQLLVRVGDALTEGQGRERCLRRSAGTTRAWRPDRRR